MSFFQPDELEEKTLRKRANQAKQSNSRQFVARIDGKEAGYLSFDDLSNFGIGVLYDLLVLPEFRCRGVGRALVEFGNNFARSLGINKTRVAPKAYDGSVDEQWLESWYRKRGYELATDCTGEYERKIK